MIEDIISRDQLLKGTRALKECLSKKKKHELFATDKVFLQFAVKKTEIAPQRIIKTTLPHGWVDSTTRVCLFVKDVDRKSREYEKTIAAYEDLLRQKSVDVALDIYPLRKLKLECNDYEAKRHLSNLYDVFLCDSRIVRLMPSRLGKHFVGRKKFLVQVKLDVEDVKEELSKGLRTSHCVVTNKGPSSQVFVGTLKQSDEDLVDNIQSVLSKVVPSIAGGSQNIRIASLKTEDSISVPVYTSFESKDEVKIEPKPTKALKRVGSLTFDPKEAEEISTVMDGVVTITPSGEAVIIRKSGAVSVKDLKGKRRKIA